MILDVVRAVADWLEDGTHGVAAKLAALDLDGSDTAPTGTLSVLDETRDDDAALPRLGLTFPSIRVQAGEVRSLDGEAATYQHVADIPLEILIAREATSPAACVRDLYYTLRATVQSVEALFNETIPAAVTARSRNGVFLQVYTSLSAARVRPEVDDTTGTAAVLLTVRAQDTTT
ncbi:MAG: hypothetical protein EKK62_16815 [Acidimicrobiia bacterium]|nr:MAG: hypothetical protein EKK62_16815 [Acidimicrobiia bacterium]